MSATGCPRCGFQAQAPAVECPACGIVFARWQANRPPARSAPAAVVLSSSEANRLLSLPRPLRWFAVVLRLGAAVGVLQGALMIYFGRGSGLLVGMGFLSLALAGFHHWLARALHRLQPAALSTTKLSSWLGLLAFPFGTLQSALMLFFLRQRGIDLLFSTPTPARRLTGAEIDALRAVHEAASGRWIVRLFAVYGVLFGGVLILAAVTIGVGRFRREMVVAQTAQELVVIDERIRTAMLGRSRYPPTQSLGSLVLSYGAELPTADPWLHPYRYERTSTGFRVGSSGADGVWTHDSLEAYGTDGDPGDDLVVDNGRLVGAAR